MLSEKVLQVGQMVARMLRGAAKPRWFLLSLLAIVSVGPAGAHPLDISLTTLKVIPSGLAATTYIHLYEISLLAETQGRTLEKLDIPELQELVLDYFNRHFTVYSRRGEVGKRHLVFEGEALYEILSSGLFINYSIPVERDDYPVTFEVDLFNEFFNTQTNKLILLDASGRPFPDSREIYLTTRRTQWSFDLNDPDFSAEQDGLTDRMERLYGMNPGEADTDGDGYTDTIEFSYGWDPFDPQPSTGQSPEVVARGTWVDPSSTEMQTRAGPSGASTERFRESLPGPASDTRDEPGRADSPGPGEPNRETPATGEAGPVQAKVLENATAPASIHLIERHRITDRRIARSSYLEKVLAGLTRTVQGGGSFGALLSLLGSVFILGFLHASMPGHGKGILFSYLAQKRRNFRQAMGFILTFTITHLVDVVVLSVGFRLLSSAYRSASISQILKLIGGTGLVLIAVYMILAGIRELRKKRSSCTAALSQASPAAPSSRSAVLQTSRRSGASSRPDGRPSRGGSAVVLGLLTGLAPCPFGWAILMVLFPLAGSTRSPR